MKPFGVLRQIASVIFAPGIGKDEITQARSTERI